MADRRKNQSPVGTTHSEGMQRRARQSEAYRQALEELEPLENLARLLIHKRMELGWTQSALAKRMGVPASEISRLESGQHRPSLKTLQAVAKGLNSRLVVGFADEDDLEKISHREAAADLELAPV